MISMTINLFVKVVVLLLIMVLVAILNGGFREVILAPSKGMN